MSASWPSSIASDSTLYVAVNELQNNLSGAINNSVTTIGLNSTTGFPTVGLVLIDNEVIKYAGISGANLTGCTRAFDGTTAASHSSGAVVSFAFCAQHHNGFKDEVIAVETYLDTVLGKGTTVTATEFGYLSGVTSAIQTQIAAKAPAASPTFSGTITTALTASRVVVSNGSSQLAVSTCTATEIDYVHGVTSAIQTQLNATVANPLTGDLAAGSHKITGLAAGTTSGDAVRYEQLPAVSGTITNWATYTPTITGFGTVSAVNFLWRRVGDTMEVRGSFTAGTVAGIATSITLNGNTTDNSGKIPTVQVCGWAADTATVNTPHALIASANATTVGFANGQAGTNMLVVQAGNSSYNTGATIAVQFAVPINGWSI